MKTATLPDFIALNDQLAALAAAGLPLDADLTRAGTEPRQALQEINAAVSRRVAEGLTLQQALAAEATLTPTYRSLVQIALSSEDRDAALAGPQRMARAVDNSWHSLHMALVYPTIVCGLAYLGFILFCLFFVPKLAGFYESVQMQPGWGLRVLSGLRTSLPYWIAGPPLVIGLMFLLVRWKSRTTDGRAGSSQWLGRLPGMSRVIFEQECSAFANTLANLLSVGTPLAEAMPLASGVLSDAALARDVSTLAVAGPQAGSNGLATRLPPFLRWALLQSEPTMPRERALRLAANVYFESAQRRGARLRVVLPIVASVVLGGSVTLLYGLALFVPVAQLLRAISS
jgi:general secretion pathway protein F